MKNTWTSRALAIFLILIFIIAILPLADGMYVRHQYHELIKAMNLKLSMNGGGFRIQEESYHLGWLHSEAKLRINFTDKELESSFVSGIEVKDDIYHGPIAYDPSRKRYLFSLANIHSQIFLPANIQNKLFSVTNANQPSMTIYSRMHFGGKLSQTFHVPVISMQQTGTINIEDSKLMSRFKLSHDQLKALSQKGSIGAIHFESVNNDKLSMTPVNFSQNMNLQESGIYNSQNDLSISQVTYVKRDNTNYILDNFKVHSERGINDKGLYNLQVKITADSLKTTVPNMPQVSAFNYSFMINNLDPAGIKQYWTFFQSHQKGAFTAADTASLQNMLPYVFTPESEFLLNVGFNSTLGLFNLDSRVNFVSGAQKVSTIFQLIAESQLDATIKISDQLLREGVTHLMNKGMLGGETKVNQNYSDAIVVNPSNPNSPSVPSVPNAPNSQVMIPQATNEKVDEFIKSYETSGYLIKTNDIYSTHITMTALGITVNGRPFSLKPANVPPVTPPQTAIPVGTTPPTPPMQTLTPPTSNGQAVPVSQ